MGSGTQPTYPRCDSVDRELSYRNHKRPVRKTGSRIARGLRVPSGTGVPGLRQSPGEDLVCLVGDQQLLRRPGRRRDRGSAATLPYLRFLQLPITSNYTHHLASTDTLQPHTIRTRGVAFPPFRLNGGGGPPVIVRRWDYGALGVLLNFRPNYWRSSPTTTPGQSCK